MSIVGALQQKVGDYMGWSSSGGMLATQDRTGSTAKVHPTGVRLYENEYLVQGGENGITLPEGLDLLPPTRYKMEMLHDEDDHGDLRILG